MARNPTNDFIQFIAGGSLFGGGIFLLANQVMVHSDLVVPPGTGRWEGMGGYRGAGIAGAPDRDRSTVVAS